MSGNRSDDAAAPAEELEVLARMRGVAKRFPRVHRRGDRTRALWRLLLGKSDLSAASVLENIDLTVHRGQSIAIIGENGAGKSTLLKVLTGVLTATEGEVETTGSVGALLELGAGFNPEHTGRENLRMNAALMGLSRQEIEERSEDIIQFADIGDYIDEPVKHYSSGMVVRLGFAVVASVRPDLLITDEVLAVGDESFQRKCVSWMEDYLAGGGTLLLVSHSMYHVQKLCQQAVWIRNGTIEASGDVFDVTQRYLSFHQEKSPIEGRSGAGHNAASIPPDWYSVSRVELQGDADSDTIRVQQSDTLTVEAELFSPDGRRPVVGIGVLRADGTPIYGTTSEISEREVVTKQGERFVCRLRIPAYALLPGDFLLRVMALDPEGVRLFDMVNRHFQVTGESREMGLVRLPIQWEDDGS